MSDTTEAQQLLQDTMTRFMESTKEARSRTSLVNLGMTNAMVAGENIHEVYERIKGEHESGDKEESETGDSTGGEQPATHPDGDGAGE